MRCLIVAAALLLVMTVGSVAHPESLPLLFLSKTVSDDYVVVGDSVEVTVTLHNYGQSPAVNITIIDTLEDNTVHRKRVDILSHGESALLKYTVTPKDLGNYPVGVAVATYSLQHGAPATEKAYSNVIREGNAYFRGEDYDDESFRGVISVVTQERYDRLHKKYVHEILAYVFLCTVPTLFPFIMYRSQQNHVDLLIRRSKMTK